MSRAKFICTVFALVDFCMNQLSPCHHPTMLYRSIYVGLVSLVLSTVARHLTMQAKQIFDQLGHKEFASYYDGNFNGDPAPTLHELMSTGKDADNWTLAANQVGVFLAKYRPVAHTTDVPGADFSSASPLYDWLHQLGSTKDGYLNVIPDRIRQPYSDSIDHIQQRAAEAVKLLEQKEYVCLQNVLSKNIKLQDSQIRFDGNSIHARLGPGSLDAAIFLGDLLLMYFKQTGHLEHNVQYKSVETAQKFGQALDDGISRLGATEDERKQFWANVSLLTGWEVIRRYSTKEDVKEILSREEHDPASVVECGLRLINNENIKNPNFLVAVALALLH